MSIKGPLGSTIGFPKIDFDDKHMPLQKFKFNKKGFQVPVKTKRLRKTTIIYIQEINEYGQLVSLICSKRKDTTKKKIMSIELVEPNIVDLRVRLTFEKEILDVC